MRFIIPILFTIIILSTACHKSENVIPTPLPIVEISTDKAVYKPGDVVTFTLALSPDNPIKVRYKYLNEIIEENTISTTTWTWTPPTQDFKGYMTELSSTTNGTEQIIGTIAVDVSSDWKNFPRYGFLSSFHEMSSAAMDDNIKRLSRYHINGLQFYEPTEKYHKPLAGTVNNPSYMWQDFARRSTYKPTVEGYIAKAHQAGMKAMLYNLINGALEDAEADGVNRKWYLFTDRFHTQRAFYDPGSAFKSPIYLMNPTHTAWIEYMASKNTDLYAVYNFDGIHYNQIRNLGNLNDFIGFGIYLSNGYNTSLQTLHWANPSKDLLLTTFNSWDAGYYTDFRYFELWNPQLDFADLYAYKVSPPDPKIFVLAAYVNYALADHPGFFNTPSVLFADAVIFALGGSHIELGEHMLCNEYFPNDNLQMKPDLQSKLVTYYDFLTAYENVLRDGGRIYEAELTSLDHKVNIYPWPPQIGGVTSVEREMDNRQVYHLLNFTNATTLQWRDDTGIQTKPDPIEDFELTYTSLDHVKKVWFASPDYMEGASEEIDFKQDGIKLSFKVPYLEYWTMIVVEY
ncbi:MAG: glycoside hydrolase family 66 protein [Saprospiraceae bacterium]|uniref:Glycoside hydrolase family 66 protein n=1 Tax=Candidatus Opimibacter skivensis TaxID=2982028 RepID=A0A9D7SS71_9BACT|nr:glycoside hydrolase family 66 protein [Candidatus Opimibacter skivensis]